MGTSSSQRSPSTPEWERVRELYRQPDPDPNQVLSRIVRALGPETRAEMSDAAVVCCLDHLLDGAVVAATGDLSTLYTDPNLVEQAAAVGLAAGLREAAEGDIVARFIASRFGDLALDALGATVLDTAESIAGITSILQVTYPSLQSHFAGFYSQSRLHDLTGSFLSHDFDHVFRHFVARDISDFVGTDALPTVSSSAILQDRIAHTCRSITRGIDLSDSEDLIRHALGQTDASLRSQMLQRAFGPATEVGLSALAAAGE